VALAFALAACVLSYWLLRVRFAPSLVQRARWLHGAACRILSALDIRCIVRGQPPSQGLVVSNHLSYLDIVIISSVMPCFFVSKSEIRRWPYFGEAARSGGTIFIDRKSRASTVEVAEQIGERLQLPIPVLLFPEGTSSDGAEVLRFHSSLFEPAIAAGSYVTAAAVRYRFVAEREERDLCWFDDTAFLPHLWKTLASAGFSAEVTFGEPRRYSGRREAAEATHDEVAAMRRREQFSVSQS
jgi:1-acyl-sn-glycerol-3-phosphate acyltransferase